MIVGVAARLPSGEIFALPRPARHCNLSAEYNSKARRNGYNKPWVGWPWELLSDPDIEEGFVIDTGDFLDRKQAEVHARSCGQLTGRMIGGILTSEDLW